MRRVNGGPSGGFWAPMATPREARPNKFAGLWRAPARISPPRNQAKKLGIVASAHPGLFAFRATFRATGFENEPFLHSHFSGVQGLHGLAHDKGNLSWRIPSRTRRLASLPAPPRRLPARPLARRVQRSRRALLIRSASPLSAGLAPDPQTTTPITRPVPRMLRSQSRQVAWSCSALRPPFLVPLLRTPTRLPRRLLS